MSIFNQYKEKYFLKKSRENAFKNNFLKNWVNYGDFHVYDGVSYLETYRISGSSVGANKMAKTFHDREMNSRISDEDGVDNADLFFDFTKLIIMTNNMKTSWLYDYLVSMNDSRFDKLHYVIAEHAVFEAYFIKYRYGTDGDIVSEDIIDDAFLNTLSWDLAETKRLSYWDGFKITFDTESVIKEENLEITNYEVSLLMNDFILDEYLIPSVEREKRYTLSDIYERIFQYSFQHNIDMEQLNDYPFLYYVPNRGFMISLYKLKIMKTKVFLKLIEESLDFKIEWETNFLLKRILTGLLIFSISIFLMFTGNVAGGLALWTGYLGEMSNNRELKILSTLLGIYSLGVEEGTFSFLNIGYTDAVQLISEISSIYYSLQTPPAVKSEEENVDISLFTNLLYDAPFSTYDRIHEYENMISVDVEIIL